MAVALLASPKPQPPWWPMKSPSTALLGVPPAEGPVEVLASFQLLSVSVIQDELEKVEFSGILTLVWQDARQAFDPKTEGVAEKIFSGDFQFNEISMIWYPQVALTNSFGQFDRRGIVLRIKPDGTVILSQTLDAAAKVNLNMRRFPFDSQRLDLAFRLLGFDTGEVVLRMDPSRPSTAKPVTSKPQWELTAVNASVVESFGTDSPQAGETSDFVVSLHIERRSLFMLRMVVVPLGMIVVLSWAVFWMPHSSVGDRMSVSFVGILTAVAYQVTLGGIVPSIAYFTLMNAFVNLSFLVMCLTVVVNLYVGAIEGQDSLKCDRIDRRCRWLFPLSYFALNGCLLAIAFAFF